MSSWRASNQDPWHYQFQNQQQGQRDRGWYTGGWIEDTRAVTLPSISIGLDEDWKRLLSKGSLHLRNVITWDSLVVFHIYSRCFTAWVKRACLLRRTMARSIWIVCFQLGLIILVVVHSSHWITSIAAVWAVWSSICAVNELLLREWQKFSWGNEVGALKRSSRGEGPAWSALALVFDWCYGTSSNPVNRACICLFKDDWLIILYSVSDQSDMWLWASV